MNKQTNGKWFLVEDTNSKYPFCVMRRTGNPKTPFQTLKDVNGRDFQTKELAHAAIVIAGGAA